MREVGYVHKGGVNDFQNYKYASEADAIRAIRPAMVNHGLCMIPSVENHWMDEYGNTHVNVHYRIFDEEGNFITFIGAGCGNDRNKNGVGDKGIYKALTGASKYALLKTFLMETGDDPEVPNAQEKETFKPPKEESVAPKAMSDAREAFVMMLKECCASCTTEAELTELWNGNRSELETTKKDFPEVHEDLKQFFKTKKEEIKGAA